MKCGLKSMSIKKVFLGGVKSALISVFESSLSVGRCCYDVLDAVKMAMYSVSRISRLVDMYHGLHAALDKEEDTAEGQEAKGEEDKKRFSCPNCKRRSWQSIETFRTHKRACRCIL